MTLSPADRQKRRRKKISSEGRVSVRLHLPRSMHARIKRMAGRAGASMHDYIVEILNRGEK